MITQPSDRWMACENAEVLEVIRPEANGANAKAAIFDFDGTISLIRSGWMEVMVPLCLEQLETLKTGESGAELLSIVEEFVWRLTGKETIYQMMALADAIRTRGGQPFEPLMYKKMYLDRLWLKIRDRVEGLRTGALHPERFLVPGAKTILQSLFDRGLTLYLASGTDDSSVQEEARLLEVSQFFVGGIFGAQNDLQGFSKALLVKRILSQTGRVEPNELLVFGDGYVEIEEVHKVGGIAVGLATAEPDCWTVDAWKRDRLIRAGADLIVPNYLDLDAICETLFHAPLVVKQ